MKQIDQDFKDWSAGFDRGCPLKGQVLPPMPANPSKAFLQGLAEGKRLFALCGQDPDSVSLETALGLLFQNKTV